MMSRLMAGFLLLGCVVAEGGVVAHYPFDADFNDASGNGRNGVLTDVGVAGNSGVVTGAGESRFGGGAMRFSADRDFLAIPSRTFSTGAAYTFSFWAKPDSAARVFNMVLGRRADTEFFIALNGTDDELRWRSNSQATGTRQVDFATGVDDVQWRHYVVTADAAGNLSCYLDGVLVSTSSSVATGFIVDTIGEGYSVGDFDFEGLIDEVWILDEAADAEMVEKLRVQNDPFPVEVDPSVTKLRVVLVGGQSNADGRAAVSGLPANLQLPQDDVDLFYDTETTTPQLTTLRPGLSETGAFGPSILLGRRVADLYAGEAGTQVAIIKYANGGTNLHTQWKAGGDATQTGDGVDYRAFQETVSAGLAAFQVKYPNAVVRLEAMLWVQGESDANTVANASAYEGNLNAFIADVRLTYGARLPFVISRLSAGQTSPAVPQRATVQAGQDAVAGASPLNSIINTDAFGLLGDKLHFNASGYQDLGRAAAKDVAYVIWVSEQFSAADVDAGKAERGADPDGDGNTNVEEFELLSDPDDGSVGSVIWVSEPGAGEVVLNYTTSVLRTYGVEMFDEGDGAWEEFSGAVAGDGGVREVSVLNGEGRGIYRVVVGLR